MTTQLELETSVRRHHEGLQNAKLPHFNGPAYVAELDQVRLTGQIKRIFDLMRDGKWRTLAEIEGWTGDGQASISAQLRHLSKPRFGGHTMSKRRRGVETHGLWEYRIQESQK